MKYALQMLRMSVVTMMVMMINGGKIIHTVNGPFLGIMGISLLPGSIRHKECLPRK